GGLHRLDDAAGFPGLERAPDRRQLDEHQVAQRGLSVVGDSHGNGGVRFGADPFVGFSVLEVLWNVHRSLPGSDHSTSTVPLRTNGGLTTRAATSLSRIVTCTISPIGTAMGNRASAIDF